MRQKLIPKPGQPGKHRPLGIPTVYDRVCEQALQNRLEPIFDPVFDEANFGYRVGRSPKDALRKVWKEIEAGGEWIVDADLKDFFGSADHEKLITLVNQRIADGRVLRVIKSILKAGCYAQGRRLPTERGTPQGAVISPLLSNILLTPFDREMRRKGYRLTRWADDWVVTCQSRAEAVAALECARRVLAELGVTLHAEKTQIVHVKHGFEFLGFNRLDRWVVRRLWSHRHKRWRNAGWRDLPTSKLYGEMGLVNLISLIPSLATRRTGAFVKAGCGRTARPV